MRCAGGQKGITVTNSLYRGLAYRYDSLDIGRRGMTGQIGDLGSQQARLKFNELSMPNAHHEVASNLLWRLGLDFGN